MHQTVRTDYLQQGDQFERNDYVWHFTASLTEDFLRKHPQIYSKYQTAIQIQRKPAVLLGNQLDEAKVLPPRDINICRSPYYDTSRFIIKTRNLLPLANFFINGGYLIYKIVL